MPVRSMKPASSDFDGVNDRQVIRASMRRIQHREWWLWSAAVLVTILLTLGLVSFVIPILSPFRAGDAPFELTPVVRGLVGLVLLFDVYVVYQQLQIYRIRKQLLQREEVFRLITENAADMIAVVDGEGHRLYNSPAYERILGYTQEELQHTTAFDQIHPDDQALVKEAAEKARLAGVGQQIEYRMGHKDGSWRILESTASVVRNPDGQVEKLVIVNRDITDRKRLEEQSRQGQKMEAIGRLSGGIAHDFNNLLGVIIGYTEILQENTDAHDPDRDCVDEILRAAQRAASLTRQLLTFSRQQVLEPNILNLNSVITDVEKMLHRVIGEDIELVTVLDPDLGKVKADPGQIEQVILNLAVNARDAMPRGGMLTINTHNITMDDAQSQSYSYPFRPGQYVLLTISDSGVGMDSATQARIFEPFFTTKEQGKGTGLGLATVYGVVKQSDGYIQVQSELGLGTIFKIYLPMAEGVAASEPAHTSVIPSLNGNETILLVEDEVALRILTRNMLERLGYTVLEAQDGPDARQISAQYKEEIQLLLTDVVMPGMNGRSLADCLAGDRPDMKVIYMSGHTGQKVGQDVLPVGCNFLAKPFSRRSLATKIREVLETGLLCAISNGPAANPVSPNEVQL